MQRIYIMQKQKIKLIKEVVDDFFNFFKNRPRLLGTIEGIEGNFLILDRINFILKYGTDIDHRELSWRAFLSYKGLIVGPRDILFETIKNTSDPYDALKKLRIEYDEWVEMKMLHKKDPENSELCRFLEKADKKRVNSLLSWCAKYPSQKAINFYSERIKGNYYENPCIAVGLAKMGDRKVLSWAINHWGKESYFEKRRLLLNCIASSPCEEGNKIVKKIIQDIQLDNYNQFKDIDCLISDLGGSANPKKYKRLEQIIMLSGNNSVLKTSLKLSIRQLIFENRDRANELLKKLGED